MNEIKKINCQFCKIPILNFNLLIHELQCSKIKIQCINCFEYYDYKSEIQKELHQLVVCKQCDQEIEKKFWNDHYCNVRIECKYCTLDLSLDKIDQHEFECGNRTEPCPTCHLRVKVAEYNLHICQPLSKKIRVCD